MTETQYKDEIARLNGELDKAHRLCGQLIGWQRDAEIKIVRLRGAMAMVKAAILRECLELRFTHDELMAIEAALK